MNDRVEVVYAPLMVNYTAVKLVTYNLPQFFADCPLPVVTKTCNVLLTVIYKIFPSASSIERAVCESS